MSIIDINEINKDKIKVIVLTLGQIVSDNILQDEAYSDKQRHLANSKYEL